MLIYRASFLGRFAVESGQEAMLRIVVGRNLLYRFLHQVARVAGMDDNLVEHIRVWGQPYGLFFHILAVEFYFAVEISEVRNLHFFGMDGILYLEGKLTVGIRDRAGRTARNRNVDIFQALFALFIFYNTTDRNIVPFVSRIRLRLQRRESRQQQCNEQVSP